MFIENYDIHVARQMVSGCDVWLNNPRRPLEASGTSGMKAGCHGCLNFSILDGWWREGYDGTNGFAIGEDSQPDNIEEQDRVDSANLYKVLTEQIIPMFYDRAKRAFRANGFNASAARWSRSSRNSPPTAWCGNTPRNITWRSEDGGSSTCRVAVRWSSRFSVSGAT